MQQVRFIYNPQSGETLITEWLDPIVDIYQQHGFTLLPRRLRFNEGEEHELFDGVNETFHHILIAGGDGTLNYVVNIFKKTGLDVPVAILPTGTANDFAHALGMPSDLPQACRKILSGAIRQIDLGRVNNQYFVNVFSCGLFTDVSQKTPTIMKNTFGKLAYYLGGIGELPNFRKMHIAITSEENHYEGSSLIFFVFNGRTAGQVQIGYLSEPDDGLLDVIVLKGDNPIDMFRTIVRFFLKRKKGDYPPGVLHFKSRDIQLFSQGRETTDVDGQAGPRLPVHITCERGALRIILPAENLNKHSKVIAPSTLTDYKK